MLQATIVSLLVLVIYKLLYYDIIDKKIDIARGPGRQLDCSRRS